jgi:hypothetical protein
MPRGKAPAIVLSPYLRGLLAKERDHLEQRVDSEAAFWAEYRLKHKISHYGEHQVYALLKIKAILLAADGLKNKQIADRLEVSQPTIGKWRTDFAYILSREDLHIDRIPAFFRGVHIDDIIERYAMFYLVTWYVKGPSGPVPKSRERCESAEAAIAYAESVSKISGIVGAVAFGLKGDSYLNTVQQQSVLRIFGQTPRSIDGFVPM